MLGGQAVQSVVVAGEDLLEQQRLQLDVDRQRLAGVDTDSHDPSFVAEHARSLSPNRSHTDR
jgi:hypothetical protein